MKLWPTLALQAALWCAASPCLAHEGHVHKVMGTIAAIAADKVEIDTPDGKRESYPLTPQTKVRGTPLGDVKPGTRVVLSVLEEGGKKRVTELRTAGPDAPGAGSAHPR